MEKPLLYTLFPEAENTKEADKKTKSRQESSLILFGAFFTFPENPGDPHKMLRLQIH